jgi:hypothetical protein
MWRWNPGLEPIWQADWQDLRWNDFGKLQFRWQGENGYLRREFVVLCDSGSGWELCGQSNVDIKEWNSVISSNE